MAARSLLRLESRPLSRALLKAKVPTETRVLMIVIATKSSISVKPLDLLYFVFSILPACRQGRYLVFLIQDTRYQILDTLRKGINSIVNCQLSIVNCC